jgi:hypothetical protein
VRYQAVAVEHDGDRAALNVVRRRICVGMVKKVERAVAVADWHRERLARVAVSNPHPRAAFASDQSRST